MPDVLSGALLVLVDVSVPVVVVVELVVLFVVLDGEVLDEDDDDCEPWSASIELGCEDW